MSAWQPIKTAPQHMRSGPFLVTNNLRARDAHDQMSHVWLTRMVHRNNNTWTAFTSGNEQIENLSHWLPLELGDQAA